MKGGPVYPGGGTMSWWTVKNVYKWSADNSAELAKGWIVQAATIAELADKIKKDPKKLEATVQSSTTNSAPPGWIRSLPGQRRNCCPSAQVRSMRWK